MTRLDTRYQGLAVALLAVGCSVFDEKLIPAAGSSDFQVANQCTEATVPIVSSNDYHSLDLTSFKSEQENLPDCLGAPRAHGKDFFMAVNMVKGDRWHFHAKSQHATADGGVESLDPAVYILTSCNDIARNCVGAVNNCGSGRDEHLTFVAPSSQTYYVGVDYVGSAEVPSTGDDVEVVAVQPVCGNSRVPEHPEFCDDGNTDPDDGCDQCRQALHSGEDETLSNKNDGPLDATILVVDSDQLATLATPYTFTVTGNLATECDFDFYEFVLPAQAKVTVVLNGTNGTDALCARADLKVDPKSSDPFELGAASTNCPISAGPLSLKPGTHLVRVNSLRSVTPDAPSAEDRAYSLSLRFEAP